MKVGEQEYRRNRRQLRQTKEPPEPVLADTQSTHDTSSNAEPDSVTQESAATREEQVISQDTSSELESPTPVRQRRSSRIRKQPDWFSRHPEWSSFSQCNRNNL